MNDIKYRGALLPEKKRSGRKQPDKKNRQKNIFVWCVLAFPLLNFLVFYVAVNAQSFLYAFQQYDSNLNLRWAGFQNFFLVLERFKNTPDFWRYTVNSLIYFLVPTAIGMPLNMVFGYLLYTKIRGGAVLRTLLLLPAMLSSVLNTLMFMKLVEEALPSFMITVFGKEIPNLLTDERYAMWTQIAYALLTGFTTSIIIYPNAMNNVNDSVVESAKIDGASHMNILWRLIVPSIYPTITTYMVLGVAGIFSFAGSLYLFFNTSAPSSVASMGYYLFVGALGGADGGSGIRDYPFLSAVGLLFTVVSAPLTLLVQWAMEKYGPSEETRAGRKEGHV